MGALTVPATGGWQTWRTISPTVNVNAGTYNLGVYAQAGGWNFNWLRITKQASAREAAELGEADLATGTQLYPNPVTRQLHIRSAYPLAAGRFRVVDARGDTVLNGALQAGSVGVSALRPGIYNLVVTTQDNRQLVRRFVKRE